MAMAPGNQAIVGGTVLRIPAIQSPDYVPGVSGWIIRIDGSAEFNSGTFRGSIEVGADPGAHFIVNNPATTDVIDVYNAANKLIFAIDSSGRLIATSSANADNVVIANAAVLFENTSQTPIIPPFLEGGNTPDQTTMILTGGVPQNAAVSVIGSLLKLITGDTSASENIVAEQRGVQGQVLQTDLSNGTGQLVHVARYSATVAGGAGLATFNHNCQFTPTAGFAAPLTNFSQWNWSDTFGTHGFNSTQAQIMPFFPGGASLGNGQVITFYAIFLG